MLAAKVHPGTEGGDPEHLRDYHQISKLSDASQPAILYTSAFSTLVSTNPHFTCNTKSFLAFEIFIPQQLVFGNT
jgi:hypothetical protein